MTATEPAAARPASRLAAIAGVGAAVLLFCAAIAVWFVGPRLDQADMSGIGGPFTLEDGQGHTVTNAAFRGKYMLIYFGYTSCPDICPTTLDTIASALDKLGADANRLSTLFITVDPQRDTPAVVARYAAAFSSKIEGLTGTAQQIASVAREYRVYYAIHRTGSGPNDYTVDHSSIIYLIGPNGRFVAPIPSAGSPDEMAAALRKHIT